MNSGHVPTIWSVEIRHIAHMHLIMSWMECGGGCLNLMKSNVMVCIF